MSDRRLTLAAAAAAAVLAAGCGGGSSAASSPTAAAGQPVNGGTLLAGIPSNPDHLDPALTYTNEGWEIVEATNNGLLTFRKAAGGAGSVVVPDIATAMPTVTDGGRLYTFHLRSGVRFSSPINRQVLPSDFKYSIQRLFKINSGGVGFYTGIVGANAFAAGRAPQISGIVANDAAMTISFRLVQPDGTFLEDMAMPFAFAMPKGTPFKDISTIPAWRVATGPYRVTDYVPGQKIVLQRNPSFHSWAPNTPGGHLDAIDITVGVTPEQSVNEVADGQLDWYFENPPPDRLAQLQRQYPSQVYTSATGEIEYFSMNERLYPFTKLAVRQAVNYATDRQSLLKLEGGQGAVTENIIPPTFGTAYHKHTFYPYDMAKARALIRQAGVEGAHVAVWSLNTDPYPNLAQYMAGQLNAIGLSATVKIVDASVYWDLISTEKNDPQIAYNNWSQDFPEGQDFVDVLLNGNGIVSVGNNNQSNADVAAYNALIEKAKRMPLGNARNAIWAQLDAAYTKNNAPWVVFMNATRIKYTSARLHGLVFNPTYYDLFPSMWLSR
ncbi:MAG TPA: ABC transporter substrate-binding protein [Gaiellales bacterium]|nr:ABC transporter substrate-binding protein [Gaiellales bacterium]